MTLDATHPSDDDLMLAVSGYNASRFVLSLPQASAVWRAGRRVMVAVAVPTSLWIALNMAISGGYSAGSLFLVNNYFGSPWRDEGRWRYWYIEVLLQLMIASMVAVTVPGLRRLVTVRGAHPLEREAAAVASATVAALKALLG